jgi:hypothetical protein
MKMKILGLQEVPGGQLMVDEWVPFTFRAHQRVLSGPDYWLIGNFDTLLLEMKVEKNSRAVLAAILPAYSKAIDNEWPAIFEGIPEVAGVPVVGTDGFERGQCREFCEFRLVHRGNQFLIVLNDELPPQRCLRVDRIGFFENGGDLCGIGFFDLHEVEIQMIMSWHAALDLS